MPLLTGSEPRPASALDRVGRDGTLSLAFERRAQWTILTQRRFTLPLQVLEPIPLDAEPATCLMLLNPTGGVLGGDRLTADISLGCGTHVCVTTPSATKIYRTLGPAAIQETTIRLGDAAVLEYVPDHVILYPGSIFHQSLSVELGPGSCVMLVDAFAIGRMARNERWLFRELRNHTTVTASGRTIFLDRFRLKPDTHGEACGGRMEEAGYVATFTCFSDRPQALVDVVQACEEYLEEHPAVSSGVSMLSRGGCVVRFLAASATDLTATTHALWSRCRRRLLNLPEVNLRKY